MNSTVAAAPPVSQGTTRGRTRITSRALQRVVAAVAGDALGVQAKHVDADLTDHGGSLDLAIHTPITVPSIERVRDAPQVLLRSGGTILQRCAAAEETVRARVKELSGYDIHRVTIRLTDIHITQERRVQ